MMGIRLRWRKATDQDIDEGKLIVLSKKGFCLYDVVLQFAMPIHYGKEPKPEDWQDVDWEGT